MSYELAKQILDDVRLGIHDYPLELINRALRLTGDLEEL